jgi:outer membrane protein assembly factor BamA
MKKSFAVFLILMLALSASAQEKKAKTGWNLGGVLPAVSFDSDLGFQYGALFTFNNYGDGSIFPEYLDQTYTEISHYTKGSGIYRFMFESNHIIPGVHWTSDISYLPDQASHFYGFNGYESVFNESWMNDEDPAYKTRMFYRFQRNQFRFKNDFQGKLSGENLKWSAGFALQHFSLDSVNVPKLNKGKDIKLPYVADQPGLFEIYKNLGLIPLNEQDGGWVNTVKAGVVWDSRDNRPNPMKGIWTEIGIEAAPKFFNNESGFAKLYLTHRQYFTLVEKNLAFVYRLGYQTTIAGHTPFYYQSQVITSMLTGATNEGLGGASTIRGVLRNRVIGNGFFFGNAEFRWKPLHFMFLKQEAYLGLNAFYDFGLVTDKIEMPASLSDFPEYFSAKGEKLHQSAGISIMPVWHENFVVAVDIGKSFDKQDGNIGFAIGLNYLF